MAHSTRKTTRKARNVTRRAAPLPEILINCDDDQLFTSSMDVAACVGMQHDDVLQAIRSLDCSSGFKLRNFVMAPAFCAPNVLHITRDGFVRLVAALTGGAAPAWVRRGLDRFNEIETIWLRRAVAAAPADADLDF